MNGQILAARFLRVACRLLLSAVCVAALACLYGPEARAVVLFADDFNRPDSVTVGNGWTSVAEPGGGFLEVSGGILTAGVNNAGGVPRAAVTRPLTFDQRITISGRLSDSDGHPSVAPGGAFYHLIAIANNGSPDLVFGNNLLSGFGIAILQDGSNGVSSFVQLFDNGTMRGVADFADNLLTSDALFTVSFDVDGSVDGLLTNPGTLAEFAFSFGPSPVMSTGANFIYVTGGNSRPSNGAEIVNRPGLDDLVIETTPEPASMFVTMLVACAMLWRIRLARVRW